MEGLTADTARRLAMIRLLHLRAEADSRLPAPYSADSLNRLHDTAEMFLLLAAETHHADITPKMRFMDYWDKVRTATGVTLQYKAQMQRMNDARVSLKHHGNEPSARTLEDARTTVRGFLYDETPRLFGVQLEDVSLASFIRSHGARRRVESAEERWGRVGGEDEDAESDAFADLSEAFDVLISDYTSSKRTWHGRSVYDLVDPKPSLRDSLHRLRMTRHSRSDVALAVLQALEPFEIAIGDALEALESATVITGLGVDLRAHGRFRLLTPRVSHYAGGRRGYNEPVHQPPRTQADFDFCRDFVISTALHLGESDYGLDLWQTRLSSSDPNTVRVRRSP